MKRVVQRTKSFEKAFKKLPSGVQHKFIFKLEIFVEDEADERLRTHRLKGNRKNEFAFSVTGDVRAIY